MKCLIAGAAALVLSATAALADDWKVLISPVELEEVVATAEPVILDIRPAGVYAEGHLEGAVNVPYAAWRGPAPNPGELISDATLTKLMSRAGITRDAPVVVTYPGKSQTDFGAAARVYWTLKSAGVEQIAILNGGIASWTGAGLPLSTVPSYPAPVEGTFTIADTWKVDRGGVQAVLDGTSDAILVDARPGDFFEGRKKHKAAKQAGTLAGAINLVHNAWFGGPVLNTDGAAVRARLTAAGVDLEKPLVSFCNTGHWAATNWFVLSEVAGLEDVKLYPESIVGWTGAGGAVTNGG